MIIFRWKKRQERKYRHINFFWVRINQTFYFNGLELIKTGNLTATDIKSGINLVFSSHDDVIVEESGLF